MPSPKRFTYQAKSAFAGAKTNMSDRKQQAVKSVSARVPRRVKQLDDLHIRLVTGTCYVVLSLVCVLFSVQTTVILLCLLSAIAAGEFFYMLRIDAKLPNELLGVLASLSYPVSVYLYGLTGAMMVTGALLVALLVWYVFWMRARIGDLGVSFFGAAYTGLLLSSLVIIRSALPDIWGGVLVALIFCSVWANDSLAYLVGSRIGKHKMAPRISPKKSFEGLIGGLFGSVCVWWIIICVPGVHMDFIVASISGLACGLAGVLGDLAESRIKRNSGVKDSGSIMPGHGGVLDRCDSLFLASVTSAVLLVSTGALPL